MKLRLTVSPKATTFFLLVPWVEAGEGRRAVVYQNSPSPKGPKGTKLSRPLHHLFLSLILLQLGPQGEQVLLALSIDKETEFKPSPGVRGVRILFWQVPLWVGPLSGHRDLRIWPTSLSCQCLSDMLHQTCLLCFSDLFQNGRSGIKNQMPGSWSSFMQQHWLSSLVHAWHTHRLIPSLFCTGLAHGLGCFCPSYGTD